MNIQVISAVMVLLFVVVFSVKVFVRPIKTMYRKKESSPGVLRLSEEEIKMLDEH